MKTTQKHISWWMDKQNVVLQITMEFPRTIKRNKLFIDTYTCSEKNILTQRIQMKIHFNRTISIIENENWLQSLQLSRAVT